MTRPGNLSRIMFRRPAPYLTKKHRDMNEKNKTLFDIFADMKAAYERYMAESEANLAKMKKELENLPEVISKMQ